VIEKLWTLHMTVENDKVFFCSDGVVEQGVKFTNAGRK
jgi:hypothetical protein